MLQSIINLWPCHKGQGWEIGKFHEPLHVPDDIVCFGSPQGTHSGPTEHNHIQHVKRPSRTTQRRCDVLDEQLANRVMEKYLIQLSFQLMDKSRFPEKYEISKQTKDIGIFVVGKSKMSSRNTYSVNFVQSEYQMASDPSMIHILHSNHLLLVMQHCIEQYSRSTKLPIQLVCFSECNANGKLFRGTQNYKHTGPWYDFAMVRWFKQPSEDSNVVNEPWLHVGEPPEMYLDHQYSLVMILGFFKVVGVDDPP